MTGPMEGDLSENPRIKVEGRGRKKTGAPQSNPGGKKLKASPSKAVTGRGGERFWRRRKRTMTVPAQGDGAREGVGK